MKIGEKYINRKNEIIEIVDIQYLGKDEQGDTAWYGPNLKLLNSGLELTNEDSNDLMERVEWRQK